MLCAICQRPTQRLFQRHGYWISECELCSHRQADLTTSKDHVTEVYGDHYFLEGGAGYPDYISESVLLTKHGKRIGHQLKRYMQPGTVLDVGCAAGFILKGLIECGWKGQGIEPNPMMTEYACSNLGLRVETGTLEDFQTNQCFDLLTMVHVVAHFYNVRTAFEAAARVCKSGGFWFIETVDKNSVVSRILGKRWHMYSPPSAIHYFSHKSLNELARQNGFQEVVSGRPAKWLLSQHAKAVLKYKLGVSSPKRLDGRLLDLVPDGMPIPYPNLDVFWALYQKQGDDRAS